jgi:aminoglycoside phosphotransferase (APT) family kinase protein
MGRMIVYAAVPDDTRDVRAAEAVDSRALAGYLRANLATDAGAIDIVGLDLAAPMEVSQFPGGHSNLTYLVRFGLAELVLRRPPLGPVPPKAHDMAREYAWLAAVHPVFPLAPEPYLLCNDPSVIGTTFYVMERRRGLVVRNEEPPALAGNPAARRRTGEAIVDALAELHTIDPRSGAVATLGKPAGFVGRQVAGWTQRWDRSKTSDVPEMDAIAAWLAARIPPDPDRAAIVHGDYKLDNVMLEASNPTTLGAIFDWEMSALGDPLVDLGIFLTYWTSDAGGAVRSADGSADALATVTDLPGWPSREDILERYAQRTGRDVSRIRFYEAFARFKIAVVIQQIYFRYVKGQTDDARFARFSERVVGLARQAVSLIRD